MCATTNKIIITENNSIIINPEFIEIISKNHFKSSTNWQVQKSIVTYKHDKQITITKYSEDSFEEIINFLSSPKLTLLSFSQ